MVDASQSSELVDDVFDRDRFLLKARWFHAFDVCDELGQPLLFVERTKPYSRMPRTWRSFLAVSLFLVFAAGLCMVMWNGSRGVRVAAMVIAGVVTWMMYMLSVRWWSGFAVYRDESRNEAWMHIVPERSLPWFQVGFEVLDADKCRIGRIRKDLRSNLTRSKWSCYATDGSQQCTAIHVNYLWSLAFRWGEFTITDGDSRRTLGELKREAALLDCRMIDLTADAERRFDRRLAVALGIVLCTIEYPNRRLGLLPPIGRGSRHRVEHY